MYALGSLRENANCQFYHHCYSCEVCQIKIFCAYMESKVIASLRIFY
uniref:Uncharacterized protein n=1 Tax=Rhizophora mucronata TaxID=61149 RepID=A0A2P2P2I5_RHIMU